MSFQGPLSDLEEKLRDLIDLRKKEEEEYGKLLTLLDQRSSFSLPDEEADRLEEIRDNLNKVWDVAANSVAAAEAEDRIFWKDVARNSLQYIQPFVAQQREFNSLTVHLLNEFVASVNRSLRKIRDFHSALILYFQKIIPVIDTKNRETIGLEDKNVAANLLKFQEYLIKASKEHADLLYQTLDRRVETIQIDSSEHSEAVNALQTSIRSLQHLANSLESAQYAGRDARSTGGEHPDTAPSAHESKYYHFEEKFRGSREEIKERFTKYVHYYSEAKTAGKVLDLGCGRGEFLELMKEAGKPAFGVDSNASMVEGSRKNGLDVERGDLLDFLKRQPENSLGGIFCSQVVEHLPPDYLMDLIGTAYTKLQPAAPILLETVNITSAFAFLHVYTKDLTHRTPIHPDTLKFLAAGFGFTNPEIIYTSPMPAVAQLKLYSNPQNDAEQMFNQNMSKLNKLLFDPQEYALLAYK